MKALAIFWLIAGIINLYVFWTVDGASLVSLWVGLVTVPTSLLIFYACWNRSTNDVR